VSDPAGDTFGSAGTEWDLTNLTLSRSANAVLFRLNFATNVVAPVAGDPDALNVFVELDLDQNPATGHQAVTDQLRNDQGSTGLGVDGGLVIGPMAPDSMVIVYDANGHETGRVKATYLGSVITIPVPRALLGGDDGNVDAAVLAGNSHGATDFAPQSGHLRFGQ
jgi:hypothetical protein